MDEATIVTGAGTAKKMQGKVMAADGKTVLDVGNEADLTLPRPGPDLEHDL